MKNIQISRKWKKIPSLMILMSGIALLNFNCSPSLFEPAGSNISSSLGGLINFEKPNAPLTLLTAEQTYQTMLNVTGQTAAPVSTAEYNLRFATLSSTDNLNNMNSPVQLASTSLGGDVCNNLLTAEKAAANRRFFTGVNFAAGPQGSEVAYASSVASMAQAFWGRAPNAEEQTILTGFFQEFMAGATNNADLTNDLYLGACAAMLSSFDALVY